MEYKVPNVKLGNVHIHLEWENSYINSYNKFINLFHDEVIIMK